MCAACAVETRVPSGHFVTGAKRIGDKAPIQIVKCGKRKTCVDSLSTRTIVVPNSPPRKVARLHSVNSSSSEDSSCSTSSVISLVHGVKAVRGGRAYMEDTYTVQTNLTELLAGPINFYSVYDGHGGDYVSQHCSEVLHQYFKSELHSLAADEAFDSTDIEAVMLEALKRSFRQTDDDLKRSGKAALVGSTAVVVLVTEDNYWIASCGDSRALLCRNGETVPLTDDHHPEREDEQMRIKEHGGFVVNRNGVSRVMGALSVSRAIGDHVLQRYGVTYEPDTSCQQRSSEDEFLILASDGLFSVLTNEEVIELSRRSLEKARARGASRDAAARISANVLTKVALHRGAQDNVTVVVVDLLPTDSTPRNHADEKSA